MTRPGGPRPVLAATHDPSPVSWYAGLLRSAPGVTLRCREPAQVLAVALHLQPSPEHGAGRDLAGVHERGLPGPVHAEAQVDAVGWLPGECLPGLSVQPACDRGGQGPGEHRQPGSRGRLQGCAGGCLVVRMAGDAGVVEDEQPFRPVPGGQPGDVICQYVRGGQGYLPWASRVSYGLLMWIPVGVYKEMIIVREADPRSSAAAHNDGALVADVPPTLPGDTPEQAGAAQQDLARAGIGGPAGGSEYASAVGAGLRRVTAQAAWRVA